jgi:hypothetical protein
MVRDATPKAEGESSAIDASVNGSIGVNIAYVSAYRVTPPGSLLPRSRRCPADVPRASNAMKSYSPLDRS